MVAMSNFADMIKTSIAEKVDIIIENLDLKYFIKVFLNYFYFISKAKFMINQKLNMNW